MSVAKPKSSNIELNRSNIRTIYDLSLNSLGRVLPIAIIVFMMILDLIDKGRLERKID